MEQSQTQWLNANQDLSYELEKALYQNKQLRAEVSSLRTQLLQAQEGKTVGIAEPAAVVGEVEVAAVEVVDDVIGAQSDGKVIDTTNKTNSSNSNNTVSDVNNTNSNNSSTTTQQQQQQGQKQHKEGKTTNKS